METYSQHLDSILYTVNIIKNNTTNNSIEVEARIKGAIISDISITRLLNSNICKWNKTTYTEKKRISKTNRKSSYRYRKFDNTDDIICKSSIVKEDITELWCTVHVSTESNVPSVIETFSTIEDVINVTRYQGIIDNHYIDIISYLSGDETNYRVEVEIIDINKIDLNLFIYLIKKVCCVLQDSVEFVSKLDWITIKSLTKVKFNNFNLDKSIIQKPVTMVSINSVLRNIKQWLVTPKIDGVRRFIYILDDIIFSIDLIGNVRFVCNVETKICDGIIIIDSEYCNEIYYIIDIVVYDEEYIGDELFSYRQTKINNIIKSLQIHNFIAKSYKSYNTFSELAEIYNIWLVSYNIDGLIFINKNIGYLQDAIKWKNANTVDLEMCILDNNIILKTSDNKIVYTSDSDTYINNIKIVRDDDNVITNVLFENDVIYSLSNNDEFNLGIWEFNVINKNYNIIRSRSDKPSANSKYIFDKNTSSSLPVNVFNGIGSIMMRKYHNKVKHSILTSLNINNAIILDIGTGQGGDITKWNKAREIYCIEPNIESVNEMKERIGNNAIKHKIFINECMLRDLNISDIPCKFSIITAFFCINQWVDEDFTKLEEIIRYRGGRKCRVAIIALTHPEYISNKCWTLERLDSRHKYKISIYNTRIVNIYETVLNITNFDKIMERCGLKKESQKRLESVYNMTPLENRLSRMYTSIVYKTI